MTHPDNRNVEQKRSAITVDEVGNGSGGCLLLLSDEFGSRGDQNRLFQSCTVSFYRLDNADSAAFHSAYFESMENARDAQ